VLLGYLAARVAEEHALDTAGDEYPVADHGTDVTVTGAHPPMGAFSQPS